jgi:hypothetical protein
VGTNACGGGVDLSKNGVISACAGSFPADTNWHHVAITWGAGGAAAYLDGSPLSFNGTVSQTYHSGTTWTVPAGVTSITVQAVGGSGGNGGGDNSGDVSFSGGSGAQGGSAQGTIAVTPGTSLTINALRNLAE